MRKISDILINEKLKLDKNTKIKNSLLSLNKGDEVYIIELNDYKYNKKIQICNVYSDGFIDFDESHYGFQFVRKNNDDVVGCIINKSLFNSNMTMVFDGNRIVISTNKEEIEKAVDDNIDSHIQPLQEQIDKLQNEIDKLQDKINNLLKEKENKYYQN